jgi:hypothetical protein
MALITNLPNWTRPAPSLMKAITVRIETKSLARVERLLVGTAGLAAATAGGRV